MFVSVSSIDGSNTVLPAFERRTLSPLENIRIERSDIEDLIATLDFNKAVGQDLISQRVLKNVRFTISKPLCILFNKSHDEGIFPSKWKTALVMPLYKKGDKHCSGNYRPVSLLSCIGSSFQVAPECTILCP